MDAIAQWIRLHLPFWGPGFESQSHHLRFSVYSQICHCVEKRTKINKRGHIFYKEIIISASWLWIFLSNVWAELFDWIRPPDRLMIWLFKCRKQGQIFPITSFFLPLALPCSLIRSPLIRLRRRRRRDPFIEKHSNVTCKNFSTLFNDHLPTHLDDLIFRGH